MALHISGSGQGLEITNSLGDSGAVTIAGGNLSVDGGSGQLAISAPGSVSCIYEDVGNGAAGAVNQSGGTNAVSVLFVGNGHGTGTYTLNGNGTLTAAGGEVIGNSGNAVFIQSAGTNTVTSEVDIASSAGVSASYTLGGSGALNVTGNLYLGGSSTGAGGGGALNISGGTASISGSLTTWNTSGTMLNLAGGTLSVGSLLFAGPSQFSWTGGTLNITGTAGVSGQTLTIPAAGILNLSANPGTGILVRNMSGISLSASSARMNVVATSIRSNRQLVVAPGLNFVGSADAWQGMLDLTNNDMDVQGGSLANITNQIKAGYNGGNWSGTSGIVSSYAAANTTHLITLGVIQNNQGGSALYSTFDTAGVGASDILIKYTYYGDATLAGSVSSVDYALIDGGYLSHGGKTGWYNGDFNYDGAVNGSDYTLIDNAFNTQGAALSSEGAMMTAEISIAPPAAVPEPTVLSLLATGCLMLLRRRRTG
jgi:hypothetical protein